MPGDPAPVSHPPPVELIAATFGLGAVRGPARYAARGELGHVWRLDTAHGAWAVKALIAPVEETTGEDAPFQLGLLAAGVPLPRPRLAEGGSAVMTGPDGAGYRVYDWIDLDPDRRVDPATAGDLLARIHRRAWPVEGVHPWFWRPGPADAWPELVARAREAGAPWGELLAGRVDALVATTDLVAAEPPERIVRCHLDFNPDNLAVGRDGRPWVIDWENSGGGDPQQELMQVLYELAGDDAGAARTVLAAYRAAGGTVGRPGLAAFAMAFTVQANLVALYARRALDGAGEDRERAARRLATLLPRLLTVGRARRLLDLCHRG
jgi:aminoglycoside phosphotransferase (APT) family kinase protein